MDSLIKIFTDIKSYIALAVGLVEGFFGPTYHSIFLIIIVAHMDVIVGYYKNKKLKGEKFKFGRVFEKLGQLGRFLVVLTASVVSDHFFQNNGLQAYFVANKVCDVFAVWQFLHMLENIGQVGDNAWLTGLKNFLSKKINDFGSKESKEEDKKDEK